MDMRMFDEQKALLTEVATAIGRKQDILDSLGKAEAVLKERVNDLAVQELILEARVKALTQRVTDLKG